VVDFVLPLEEIAGVIGALVEAEESR